MSGAKANVQTPATFDGLKWICSRLLITLAFSSQTLCLSVCLSPSFSLSFQFKKFRLSVGHTNNYAKSVVNMADMVRIVLIPFLESLPQALPSTGAAQSSVFCFTNHTLQSKPLMAHNMLQTAINQSKTAAASRQHKGRYFNVLSLVATSVCSATEIWPAAGSCL